MKDRPILFSGPMVRAILEGRKTQTRRIIKPQPECLQDVQAIQYHLATGEPFIVGRGFTYGQPGDWLWVKETWRTTGALDHVKPSNIRPGAPIEYNAGGHNVNGFQGHPLTGMGKWRPSIFMSKWMSRVILEIVSVRAEKLRDISNEDCLKEGMSDATNPELKANRKWFSELWESINGPFSWDVNPWVWAVEFKEVKP